MALQHPMCSEAAGLAQPIRHHDVSKVKALRMQAVQLLDAADKLRVKMAGKMAARTLHAGYTPILRVSIGKGGCISNYDVDRRKGIRSYLLQHVLQGDAHCVQHHLHASDVGCPAICDPVALLVIHVNGGIGEHRREVCIKGGCLLQADLSATQHNRQWFGAAGFQRLTGDPRRQIEVGKEQAAAGEGRLRLAAKVAFDLQQWLSPRSRVSGTRTRRLTSY